MNDQIQVSFGALGAAASEISSQANQVQSQLDDLKGRLAPVIAQWEGGTSEAYQVIQKKWDDSAADIQQVLAAIGTAVASANDAYSAAESKNTARW
ncbi:early secretory antigenic target protein ESAT-6 [Saccharothrix tamanrassetensis]|uniref:ESAT-6-like protein n=1 Tax=Saccharothrix tamanrassetensis TaxID=1051531 RepID=A0A841CEU7_9PSEU|nr:WXG100 family type VII secretion target [Saccharothrix tamanrassetensis]MBB5954894.1 early secretory antigenic target protein ESAT-6 [Saccharothrix tamanrassetensis]